MWRRPCGCSSHARMGGRWKRPARATGPRCRGGYQVFCLPHRSASSALCPCGHAASFRRRASSFMRGVWCLGVRRRCFRWRCYASARGVRGVQGGVLVRGAALWLWLLLRRRVCCDSHGDGHAWRGGCARGGCVVRALGAMEGVRLASCRRCGRGVVSLCGRCACGSPVPVLETSLMPPQAVGAVVMAMPPWCVVRVHGVAGCPLGTAARGVFLDGRSFFLLASHCAVRHARPHARTFC